MDIVKTIKERREMLNVGLRTLQQFESGKANPTLQTIEKLCDVLGLQVCLKVKD
jgi:transcriptional regulator with XRE-family HTH domain